MTQRPVIEIDETLCNGCGECVPSCQEGAIQIIDGKAKLMEDRLCDGLGACLGHCPRGALKVVIREAATFDKAAVHHHLDELRKNRHATGGGCPSARVQQRLVETGRDGTGVATGSALQTWPIQVDLVPPTAPFLRGAHLLVAASCTSFSYARFHADFLKGRILLIGCPKLNDVAGYVAKFAEIFAMNDIASVTAVVMQVPCCQGLPQALRQAMDIAGAEVPAEKTVISLEGEVLRREPI